MVFQYVGSLAGVTLTAALRERTGAFSLAFAIFPALTVVAALNYLALGRRSSNVGGERNEITEMPDGNGTELSSPSQRSESAELGKNSSREIVNNDKRADSI